MTRQLDRPKTHVPETKSYPVLHFKALKGTSDPPGTFEAIVAVFDNIDAYGDRMIKGAFTRTLEERGMPPIIWSHDWMTPPIGATSDAEEREAKGDLPAGLYLKARLLVDQDAGEDHPVARMVWASMTAQGGDGKSPLREFSFGYRTRKAQWVEEDPDTLPPDAQWTGGEIRNLLDVDLWEAGPTLLGANPATALIAAKAAVIAAVGRGVDVADLSSAEFRKLLRTDEREDTPGPNGSAKAMPEEVRARIDAANARRPTHL